MYLCLQYGERGNGALRYVLSLTNCSEQKAQQKSTRKSGQKAVQKNREKTVDGIEDRVEDGVERTKGVKDGPTSDV